VVANIARDRKGKTYRGSTRINADQEIGWAARIAVVANIARDRKPKSSPLMNADDTNQEWEIGKAHKMTVIPAAIRAFGKFVMD